MNNLAMERKLKAHQAIDVAAMPRLGPYYVISEASFDGDKDYCDASTESWVWSIGKCDRDFSFVHDTITHLAPAGTILISLDNDLYLRDGVTCLWLR